MGRGIRAEGRDRRWRVRRGATPQESVPRALPRALAPWGRVVVRHVHPGRSCVAGGRRRSPLGPHTPERVLAVGESQSAACLVTYINAVDSQAAAYDGFLVHGRGSSGAGLDGFRLTPADRDDVARSVGQQPGECIRDDVRVPVLVLQSETDVALLGGGRADHAMASGFGSGSWPGVRTQTPTS